MPARRGRPAGQARVRRPGVRQVSQLGRGRRRPGYRAGDWALIATGAAALMVALAVAATTKTGHAAALAVQRFLLFYAGVFALIALTASVGAGLAAADRVIMSPGGRIAAQAAHRAASFAAVVFLAIHIATEVLAGRSGPAAAVVPFLGPGRAFYLGLGTVASDLLVVIVVTGLLRGRFAGARPAWLWRALHAIAYACWPIAIIHGLLAGRTAKPYVDWSYGACVAAVALALVFRAAAGPRAGETAASPVEPPAAGIPGPAMPSAAATLPGAGGPGLPAPGFPHLPAPGFPYVPAPGSPRVPGAAGAWGRRALPGPAHAAGSAQDGGPAPGAGPAPDWHPPADPGYPSPGLPGPGWPGPGYQSGGYQGGGYQSGGYQGGGYQGGGYQGGGYPAPGWPGYDEPAQAPCPGDGGR